MIGKEGQAGADQDLDGITEEMVRVGAKILMEQLEAGPCSARSVAKQVFERMRAVGIKATGVCPFLGPPASEQTTAFSSVSEEPLVTKKMLAAGRSHLWAEQVPDYENFDQVLTSIFLSMLEASECDPHSQT